MTNQVTILPGAQGVKAAYERILKEKSLDIVCLAKRYEEVLGDYFDQEYAPRLYGKIKTREVLPDTKENRNYAKSKDERLNQVRYTSNKTSETDFILGSNLVVLISYNQQNPMAVVIEEPELVKAMKGMFESVWEQGSE